MVMIAVEERSQSASDRISVKDLGQNTMSATQNRGEF
jgi:hypothetical protein